MAAFLGAGMFRCKIAHKMKYLGTYKITPNSATIEVDCYGTDYPAQMETLCQEGFSAYAELEKVECSGINITDYLSDNDLDLLTAKINEK